VVVGLDLGDNHRALAFFQALGARQRASTGGTLDLVWDLQADRAPARPARAA
jgi:hypothetical protein